LGTKILSSSASNGSGLQELLTDADFTPCMQRNSFGGCVRGTLMIDSWLDLALYTQRYNNFYFILFLFFIFIFFFFLGLLLEI
jgi:hypothetical protein